MSDFYSVSSRMACADKAPEQEIEFFSTGSRAQQAQYGQFDGRKVMQCAPNTCSLSSEKMRELHNHSPMIEEEIAGQSIFSTFLGHNVEIDSDCEFEEEVASSKEEGALSHTLPKLERAPADVYSREGVSNRASSHKKFWQDSPDTTPR